MGADKNKCDAYGWIPLMYGANRGHVGCVKALLSMGAKDRTDSSGKTALTYATDSGYQEIVRLLQQAA